MNQIRECVVIIKHEGIIKQIRLKSPSTCSILCLLGAQMIAQFRFSENFFSTLRLHFCKVVNMSTRSRGASSSDKSARSGTTLKQNGNRPSRGSDKNNTGNSHKKPHSSKHRYKGKPTSAKPKVSLEDRKVILFNKPFDTLSQFTDGEGRKTLADFIPVKDVYAAGRLDRDSEGLMVLTNDGIFQAKLTQPNSKSPKTYWVQVEGAPSEEDLDKLRKGVELKDGMTLPAQIEVMSEPVVWERTPQCVSEPLYRQHG